MKLEKSEITHKIIMEVSSNISIAMNDTMSSQSASTVGVENLYPALIECFGIIALGYLAGR